MVDCPTCDDVFSSTHGMRIHHVQAHGESLAGEKIACEQCGETFTVQRDKVKERRFCSRNCVDEWRSETFVDDEHHRYNRVTVTCDNCGDEVERPPSLVEGSERNFCDADCRAEVVGDELSVRRRGESNPMYGKTGEEHPNWSGGYNQNYGEGWNQARRQAVDRDDYQCQDCGMSRDEHYDEYGADLEVHHIQPFRTFEDAAKANQLSNLVTLCTNCHVEREHSAA
jgi:hypothetical protein